MRKRVLIIAILTVLLSLVLVFQAAGLPTDAIIVNNADEVREESVSVTQGVLDSVDGVVNRILVEFTNTARHEPLPPLPGDLDTLQGQVDDRVVVEFSNTTRHEALPALPGTLNTLQGQVVDRVLVETANNNRTESLGYPLDLIDDNQAPNFSNFSVVRVGETTIEISWITNEFATTVLRYGIQSGNYTETIADSQYVEQHEMELTGLQIGETYFYRVSGTDLSGNEAQSNERSYELIELQYIYLPAVVTSSN